MKSEVLPTAGGYVYRTVTRDPWLELSNRVWYDTHVAEQLIIKALVGA
ncbi:hypothetical protein SEA_SCOOBYDOOBYDOO_192 [Mycobacterium phage ScoobyDoobyDoo]|nr:hypothetical protein SEA_SCOOBYDOOBYDOO_192 [Mycobacterium phage ScoobyDoobyDoo]